MAASATDADDRRRAFRETVERALRHDPMGVVFGAIRDAVSAQLAAEAAAPVREA